MPDAYLSHQTKSGIQVQMLHLQRQQMVIWPNDPIHHMVNTMLTENQGMIPKDSIVVRTKLSIPSPEEYSGSLDLEVTFDPYSL